MLIFTEEPSCTPPAPAPAPARYHQPLDGALGFKDAQLQIEFMQTAHNLRRVIFFPSERKTFCLFGEMTDRFMNLE